MYVCMSMYVCMYVCMYVFMYVCMHVSMYLCLSACLAGRLCVCLSICLPVRMHVCTVRMSLCLSLSLSLSLPPPPLSLSLSIYISLSISLSLYTLYLLNPACSAQTDGQTGGPADKQIDTHTHRDIHTAAGRKFGALSHVDLDHLATAPFPLRLLHHCSETLNTHGFETVG